MDYNQLKALSSFRRVAGPRAFEFVLLCFRTTWTSQFVVAVCCVSLLCQFVVSRFVERGFVCLLLSFL